MFGGRRVGCSAVLALMIQAILPLPCFSNGACLEKGGNWQWATETGEVSKRGWRLCV